MMVTSVVTAVWLGRELQRQRVTALATELRRETQLARALLQPPAKSEHQARQFCRRLKKLTQARVTLIAANGVVVADSDGDVHQMDNHLWKPEIQQALRSGYGQSERFSETTDAPMLFVCMIVPQATSPVHLLRLGAPLEEVYFAVKNFRRRVLILGLAMTTVGAMFFFFLANALSKTLKSITQAFEALARGELPQHLACHSNDELEELTHAFEHMTSHFEAVVKNLERGALEEKLILSNMSDGIIVTNAEGKILLFNNSAQQIFGVALEQALGRTISELSLHFELSRLVSNALSSQTSTRGEVNLLQPRNRILECSVTPIRPEDGSVKGAVVVLRDLTQVRMLEAVRKDFVANVSHELRTPVASIRAMAETLLMGAREDPDSAERFLKIIHDESVRLSALLDDLLSIALLDADEYRLEKKEVNVEQAIARVLQKVSPQLEEKGLCAQMHIPPTLHIMADEDALERILLNIIDNAVKYTPKGGEIVITARQQDQPPTDDVASTRREVCLAIADTGIGIPESELPRIFERFYRVDKARSREVGGTGLGLSIVKHLVERHGGRIDVQSEVGKGSTFTLTFPG